MSDWSHRAFDGSMQQTGFGRQHNSILSYLHSRGWEVHELGVGYTGQTWNPSPWPVYSPSAFGRFEGQDILPHLGNSLDVDVVFQLCDVPDLYLGNPSFYRDRRTGQGMKEEMIAHIDAARWKKVAYTVIDGACPNDNAPPEWKFLFSGYDGIAVATRWGCDLVEKNFRLKPTYIPHSVDTSLFSPVDMTLARQRFGIDPEAFVILGVGVNRRRKMIPAWFESVAKFVKETRAKKILFWVHSYRTDAPGYDLQALANHYGLKDLGVMAINTDVMPEQAMSALYSASNICLNLSGGEGCGLVALEAGACRIPTLVTAYTGMVEQVPDIEDNFLRVPPKVVIAQEGNAIAWAWPDTDIAAERLEKIWSEPKFRTKLKRASWEHSQRFRTDVVLPKFERWLEQIVESEVTEESLTVDVV